MSRFTRPPCTLIRTENSYSTKLAESWIFKMYLFHSFEHHKSNAILLLTFWSERSLYTCILLLCRGFDCTISLCRILLLLVRHLNSSSATATDLYRLSPPSHLEAPTFHDKLISLKHFSTVCLIAMADKREEEGSEVRGSGWFLTP